MPGLVQVVWIGLNGRVRRMLKRMTGWAGLLLLGAPGHAGAEPPELEVTWTGAGEITVSVVGAKVEEGWILQHSYDGLKWWDLDGLDGSPARFSVTAAPSVARVFRAAQKPPATRQEALTQARERWEVGGLVTYQYRAQTTASRFPTDDLTLVRDGEVEEWTSMLPPGSPDFQWGDQTIEDLFDRLQREIDRNAHMMDVSYDPEWGYPVAAYVDPDARIADEEWGFSIIEPPSDPEASHAAAERLWQGRGIDAYEFDLRYETAGIAWEGTIRGEGARATVVAGDEPPPGLIVMTFEGYFALIGAALTEGRVTSATYDPELGHPLFFSRDWYLTEEDGPGERFWISGFRSLDGP